MKGFSKYKSNNNIVFSCQYHVVWCPKYRRKVLVDGVDERLKSILKDVALNTGSEILEMEIMEDHVHLLLSVDPQFGINKVVRTMKGKSSNILRKEFPWLKKQNTISLDRKLFLLYRWWCNFRYCKTIYWKSKKRLIYLWKEE